MGGTGFLKKFLNDGSRARGGGSAQIQGLVLLMATDSVRGWGGARWSEVKTLAAASWRASSRGCPPVSNF